MPWTSRTSEVKETACPQFQSRYKVRVTRLPTRDRDDFNCVICGYELDSWNSTSVPSYRLTERMLMAASFLLSQPDDRSYRARRSHG
jgi:hypothetical protein